MFTFVTSCCSPHISTSQQKSSTECLIWCQSGCVRILPFDRLRGLCHSTVSTNRKCINCQFEVKDVDQPGHVTTQNGDLHTSHGLKEVLFRVKICDHCTSRTVIMSMMRFIILVATTCVYFGGVTCFNCTSSNPDWCLHLRTPLRLYLD